MDIASSRPQTATEILMDTQTEIKELIKQALFSVTHMITFNERVEKLIDKNIAEIENEELRKTAKETLLRYARQEYQTMVNLLNFGNLPILLAFSAYTNKEFNKEQYQAQMNEKIKNLGRADINRAYSQLGNSQAKVGYGQSLYGHSELVARHEEQVEMVDNLKQKTNLVICDTHSDCSDRCFPWQGRIYSLDGTYGKTEDGKDYVPLEVATEAVFKGHRNGLLGYNCRHKLHAYKKGMKANKVTKQEQQREKALSAQQRLLEREIRHTKDMALSFKGVDEEKARKYREQIRQLSAEYKQFCQENNRVEYRSRLQI